jgi:hypothetical protein
MFKVTKEILYRKLLMNREKGVRLMTYLGPKWFIGKVALIIFTIILLLQNNPILRATALVGAGYLVGMIAANIRSFIIIKNAWPLQKEIIDWIKVERAVNMRAKKKGMFERFTDRARKVIALANQEAHRLKHEYIRTEHILLGLVKEGSGIGATVLKNSGIEYNKVKAEIEKLVKTGPDMVTMEKLPLAPIAEEAVEYANEEARALNHNYVGTEHILLGLMKGDTMISAQVLQKLGLNLEDGRKEILKILCGSMEKTDIEKEED